MEERGSAQKACAFFRVPKAAYNEEDYYPYWEDDGSGGRSGLGERIGGEAGSSSSGDNGWGPYQRDRFSECRQKAMQNGAKEYQLPNTQALDWIMSAYVIYGVDPAILASVWSQESNFSTSMVIGVNKNRRGEKTSRDYGPLQINSYYKLNNISWQKKFNPSGIDLTQDAFNSFLAGAHDLAVHRAGGDDPSLGSAAAYWHGPNSRDIGSYARSIYSRFTGIASLFECMKDDNQP